LSAKRLSEERYFLKARTYVIVTLVLTILLIVTKEEVQGCTLDLGDRMKASQRDNGDGLYIVPVFLSIVTV
jgi:hypothetical protein